MDKTITLPSGAVVTLKSEEEIINNVIKLTENTDKSNIDKLDLTDVVAFIEERHKLKISDEDIKFFLKHRRHFDELSESDQRVLTKYGNDKNTLNWEWEFSSADGYRNQVNGDWIYKRQFELLENHIATGGKQQVFNRVDMLRAMSAAYTTGFINGKGGDRHDMDDYSAWIDKHI